MAGSVLDSGGGRDELKTQFMTREGTYHLMTLAGYCHHHQPELIKAITNATFTNAIITICNGLTFKDSDRHNGH